MFSKLFYFVFNGTATPEIYTLSLHEALPICRARRMARWYDHLMVLLPFEPPYFQAVGLACTYVGHPVVERDRKSTRLNSSHQIISYAVFCLKKKNKQ